jgi:hypothetical protein
MQHSQVAVMYQQLLLIFKNIFCTLLHLLVRLATYPPCIPTRAAV